MTTYTIQAPDGKTYTIDGPEGQSQSQVIAEILKQNPDAATAPDNTPTESFGGKVKDNVNAFLDAIGNQLPLVNKMPNTWGGDEAGAQAAIKQNTATHPIANVAGDVVGSTLPYVAGGAVMGAAKAPMAAKALLSGVIGGAQGYGNADPNASTTSKIIDTGIGGAAGSLGEVLAPFLHSAAVSMAPRAVGASKAILNKLTPQARQEMGEYLLTPSGQNGVAQRVLTPFKGSAGMTAANEANKASAGSIMEGLLNNADKTGNNFDTAGAIRTVNDLRSNVPNAPINMLGDQAVNNSIKDLTAYGETLGTNNSKTIPGRAAVAGTPDLRTPTDMDVPSPNPGQGVVVGSGTPSVSEIPDTTLYGPGHGNLSLTDARKLSTQYGKLADWKPMTPQEQPVNDVNKSVYSIIRDYINGGLQDSIFQPIKDAALKRGSKAVNIEDFTPEEVQQASDQTNNVLNKFGQANQVYRNAARTDTALDNLAAMDQGNNLLGISAKTGMAAGMGAGGPAAVPGALAAGVATEVGNRLLPKAFVSGLEGASKSTVGALPQAANGIAGAVTNGSGPDQDIEDAAMDQTQKNSVAPSQAPTTDLLRGILQSSPDALGQYAAPLQDAASRGDDRLAALQYVLSTSDPQFRQLMDQATSAQAA